MMKPYFRLLSLTMTLVLGIVLCVPLFVGAAEAPAFDFSGSPATVQKLGDVHSLTFSGTYGYTLCTGSNVAFRVRFASTDYQWVGFALDNTGPAGLANGRGIRTVMFNTADGSGENLAAYSTVTTRIVDTDAGMGWEAAAASQQVQNGTILSAGDPLVKFNDGEWHTVVIKKESGNWTMTIDGKNAMTSRYDGLNGDLDDMLGGEGQTYLTFYTSSATGTVEVEQMLTQAADKTTLKTKLDAAKTQFNSYAVGSAVGNVSQQAHNTFAGIINSAQTVYDNASATPAQIEEAINALQKGAYDFALSVIAPVDKTELNNVIANAEDLLGKAKPGTGDGQVAQTAIDKLSSGITAAQNVAQNGSSTQLEVENVTKTLHTVIEEFLAAVVPLSGDGTAFAFSGVAVVSGKDAAGINIVDDVFTVDMPDVGSLGYTPVTASKLEFNFRIDPEVSCGWFGLILSNNGWRSLGGGNGVTLLFWNNTINMTGRLTEEIPGKGWDSAASKEFLNGPCGDIEAVFNDGEWHSFQLTRSDEGRWDLLIDGKSVITNRYADFDYDMDRLLGPINETTMSLFTNGDPGVMEISQGNTKKSEAEFSELTALIQVADTLLKETAEADVSAAQRTALTEAVAVAKALTENTDASRQEIADTQKALHKAINRFRADVITVENSRLPAVDMQDAPIEIGGTADPEPGDSDTNKPDTDPPEDNEPGNDGSDEPPVDDSTPNSPQTGVFFPLAALLLAIAGAIAAFLFARKRCPVQ